MVAKDPGFSPLSLLELLKRRGRHRPEDFARLHLATPLELQAVKATWLALLDQADAFARSWPPEEVGCLYYSPAEDTFKLPLPGASLEAQRLGPHYGEPGGVLPRVAE